jgi:predicted O-methyltransferase YrrM
MTLGINPPCVAGFILLIPAIYLRLKNGLLPSTEMIHRLVIDSSAAQTELCFLGNIAGTDKSPVVSASPRHRHAYTAVYTMLFAPLKGRAIQFAEIGVAGGHSALLWNMYFKHPETTIHMFDRDQNFLRSAEELVDSETMKFSLMDVGVDGDVRRALTASNPGGLYDVIIDDSSHEHGHQIRIIKEAFPLLTQGGVLIVEDIFRSTPEEEYTRLLGPILHKCSAAYFVQCEHKDRWSPGWDNDKLLVLVKA